MKPIFLKFEDDRALLGEVGTRGVHNRCIRKNKGAIIAAYDLYLQAIDRPSAMKTQTMIPADLAEALAGKYTEGRKGDGVFSYLEKWANNPGSVSCPYCGRKGLGTIDHYLPQSHFPVFSVYSKNMVPACQACQTIKLARYRGKSGRPIHPLLDRFGISQEVIIRTSIHDSGDLAESSFIFAARSTYPKYPRRIRKKECLLLNKHCRFFKLSERDEVINDCILELNDLRSCLSEENLSAGDPKKLREWLAKLLVKAESNRDVGSAPFLREALIRGFLVDEYTLLRFAHSDIPVTQFTKSEMIDMLKER